MVESVGKKDLFGQFFIQRIDAAQVVLCRDAVWQVALVRYQRKVRADDVKVAVEDSELIELFH